MSESPAPLLRLSLRLAGITRAAKHVAQPVALLLRQHRFALLDGADACHAQVGAQPLDLAHLGLRLFHIHRVGPQEL